MFGPESVYLVMSCGFGAFVGNCLYTLGGTNGMGGKWLRRFLGAFVLTLTVNLCAVAMQVWHWQYLLFMPILSLGFSLGYGANTVTWRILKRTFCSLAITSVCVIGAWVHQFSTMSLIVGGLSVFTGITSVVLGVLNPFSNARVEEFLVSQVLTIYVVFWPFVR